MADSLFFITPAQLKEFLHDGKELALLDVREQGRFFNDGHLLFACPLPLSALELRIADLVPRKSTRVVLCDGGDGLARRAAEKLAGFGYPGVSVLEGDAAGWKAAGFELFSGFNVPSKAFGEFVEHAYGTPSISADELKEMMERGEDMVVVDSRPMDEYHVMNIPTGIDVPGAELALRIHDIAPSPDTTVVVNCAGRTRGIIGAQSLINAGIPNKVLDLRNGTMGWHLAGNKLEHGSTRRAAEPSPEGLRKAKEAAGRVAARFGVNEIDAATLEQWRGESDGRTLPPARAGQTSIRDCGDKDGEHRNHHHDQGGMTGGRTRDPDAHEHRPDREARDTRNTQYRAIAPTLRKRESQRKRNDDRKPARQERPQNAQRKPVHVAHGNLGCDA